MTDRDELRDQVAAALFHPGSSTDQAVERAIAVVAEEIAQAIEEVECCTDPTCHDAAAIARRIGGVQ